ncbi:MliC family protein [Microvirga lenta]|nr:MliC family protein [Microvirga lenta]MCB5175852.1 MliC family protein [Microvirga lenta]
MICLCSPVSLAADVTIALPGSSPVERNYVSYKCQGGLQLKVEYINAGPNSLAVVPVSGSVLVFANVMSGSGARYAAGPYIWWTKGTGAELYDQRQGGGSKPIACTEVGSP